MGPPSTTSRTSSFTIARSVPLWPVSRKCVVDREALGSGEIVKALPHWDPGGFWLTPCDPPYEKLTWLLETFTDFFEAYVKDTDGLIFS